jgi:hypothetical protein
MKHRQQRQPEWNFCHGEFLLATQSGILVNNCVRRVSTNDFGASPLCEANNPNGLLLLNLAREFFQKNERARMV